MKIEKDVEIPMRDGARLRADVLRPKGARRVPAIMNLAGRWNWWPGGGNAPANAP